jgi:hypothetical protein
MVNHIYQMMGGRNQGHQTAGGDAKKYLAHIRISLFVSETVTTGTGDEKELLGYVISGSLDKLKYGGKGRKFTVVNLPGLGINRNLSNVWSCFQFGLATREATVKCGGKSIGYMKNIFQAAREGKDDYFEPFMIELENWKEKSADL